MEKEFGNDRGLLQTIAADMASSDGWHMGLRLRDGTTMELAVLEVGTDGLEDFVVLDSGEIPGRPFGGRLYVAESAVAMAWATEDPCVIAPSVTPGGPREAFFAKWAEEGAPPRPPAGGPAPPLEPTKCAWPTIAPLGSRWLDAAIHEHRVWVRGNGDKRLRGDDEWTEIDPSYQVADRPYIEVESPADGWAVPPGWEGADLAVAPSFAPSIQGWPLVVRWGDLSDQEVNDALCGAVLRATRYSPISSAIIFPAAWADGVADFIQDREAARFPAPAKDALVAAMAAHAGGAPDPYAGGLEEWEALEMLLALPTLRWEAELNAPRLRELLRRSADRLKLLRMQR